MDKSEFSQARRYLGKTQVELADLLCVSPKAVQSFEQGWRKIPASAERQLLFLLSLKRTKNAEGSPCWETRHCSVDQREKCVAREFDAGYFCWFISGTKCEGKRHTNWKEKIQLCRQCEVYKNAFPDV